MIDVDSDRKVAAKRLVVDAAVAVVVAAAADVADVKIDMDLVEDVDDRSKSLSRLRTGMEGVHEGGTATWWVELEAAVCIEIVEEAVVYSAHFSYHW